MYVLMWRAMATPWFISTDGGSRGMSCRAAAHGLVWSVGQPVNAEMMGWPLDAIPRPKFNGA
jgi:hypothetical protein